MSDAPWLKDPYWKLKPTPFPLEEDICHCATLETLLLRPTIGPNPIDCAKCGGEVHPPERLGLPPQLIDGLATWREFYYCFYHLWLDSGEFERWAIEQLESPDSAVNKRALEIRARLGELRPTYYWWFQDREVDELDRFTTTRECPICRQALSAFGTTWPSCESCWIVLAG